MLGVIVPIVLIAPVVIPIVIATLNELSNRSSSSASSSTTSSSSSSSSSSNRPLAMRSNSINDRAPGFHSNTNSSSNRQAVIVQEPSLQNRWRRTLLAA